MDPPQTEKDLGIEIYASKTRGIGGTIKNAATDFVVEEILMDGSIAQRNLINTPLPEGWGRYLLSVLCKTNWDTFKALHAIASKLNIEANRIQIAGLKDAKAFTSQFITVSRLIPIEISSIKIKDLTITPIGFLDEKLSSSLLYGNYFHITIRTLVHKKRNIVERIRRIENEIKEFGGLPNYFGHQRFGTIRPISHIMGRLLIKRKFDEAVLIFLSQHSQFEHPESRWAREELRANNDYKKALHYFPRNLMYERNMIHHLAKYPRDYIGALKRLPSRLIKLFIHAYQSYLFNKFLSQRIKQNLPLKEAEIGDYLIDLDDRGISQYTSRQTDSINISRLQEKLRKDQMKIALPLIGYKQGPSEGRQGTIERKILDQENISRKEFRIPEFPEICLNGALRTATTRITKVILKDPSIDDYNPLLSKIELSFKLNRGTYATVLLREIMKPKDLIISGF